MTRPTEPLRVEHRELLPRLEGLRTLAASLAPSAPKDVQARVDSLVRLLREHLVPHARAEEVVLYPAVERVMGAPGAMATMIADHVEVVRRIDRLADTASALDGKPLELEQLRELQEQLYGLWAILLLHFDKEETVLLPVLDERLSSEDADALFSAMATGADS